MPELPEVETVARGLHRRLAGTTITGAAVYWPRTLARPALDEFSARSLAGGSNRSDGVASMSSSGWTMGTSSSTEDERPAVCGTGR